MTRFLTAALFAAALTFAACEKDEATNTPSPSTSPSATTTPAPESPTATATATPATPTSPSTETAVPSPSSTPEALDPIVPSAASAADLRALASSDSSPFAACGCGPAQFADLAQNPVYFLDGSVDGALSRLDVHTTIAYTNITSAPRTALYLRVFANAPYFGDGANVTLGAVLVDGAPVDAGLNQTVLTVPLEPPLAPGAAVRVDVTLSAGIPALDGPGLDLGSLTGGDGNYGLFGFGNDTLILGHWYPTVIATGAEAAPPLDFPLQGDISFTDASFFDVRLTLPAGMTVAGSGTQFGSTDSGAFTTTEWVVPPAREAAFLASKNFAQSERDGVAGHVTVRAVYPSSTEPALQATLLDTAAGAVEAYEERFGPYVYPDLDVVIGPLQQGASGMEFSGLVVIDDDLVTLGGTGDLSALLDDPTIQAALEEFFGDLDLSSLLGGGGDALAFTVAHEVAHQWWFGAVGSDSINDPWMDEALTNYSAVLYFEDRHGAEAAQAASDAFLAGAYTSGRLFDEDAVVDQPADAFSALQYGGVVYGKGALFYDALRKAIGDDEFFAGLKAYYAQYRYGLAPDAAQIESFETVADDTTVAGLYQRWIKELHGDEDIGAPAAELGDLGDLGDLGALLEALLSGR